MEIPGPTYDVVIIGGGPIGLACAIEARRRKLSHIILEKGVLVNSIYHFPVNMTFFSTSNLLEIGDVPFIAHADKPSRREALEYYRRVVESWQLNLHVYEPVTGMYRLDDAHYAVVTGKSTYRGHAVIVATGFYDCANLMEIPGESLPKVKHYYDDPHPYIGQKVVVVGAANSACDVALETYYKGAEVTMVIREAQIRPNVKYWIRPNIENRIKEGSIKAHFNATLLEIREKEVDVMTLDGKITLDNDWVLAMTGYHPNYEFLERIGIRLNRDEFQTPTCNPESLETNLPRVYVAGVICAGLQTNRLFIENSRVHAEMILDDLQWKLQPEEA